MSTEKERVRGGGGGGGGKISRDPFWDCSSKG